MVLSHLKNKSNEEPILGVQYCLGKGCRQVGSSMATSGDVSVVGGGAYRNSPPTARDVEATECEWGWEGPWEEPVRGYEGITVCRVERGERETFLPG